MDDWLIQLERDAFFNGDLGYVEECTYWDPFQDPDVDEGAPVSASLKRTSRQAQYEDRAGGTDRSATAVLNRGEVELVSGEPNDYGTLEDQNGERWTIDEITGENDALWKVSLTKPITEHFGGVRARE